MLKRCWLVLVAVALVAQSAETRRTSPPGPQQAVHPDAGKPGSVAALFDRAWRDFDEHYAYFVHKHIDWGAVRAEHEKAFTEDLGAEAFAERLAAMLEVLHDWHVSVRAPSGRMMGYSTPFATNLPSTPRNRYTRDGYEALGGGVIRHGWLDNQVAYIRIDSLVRALLPGVRDEDLDRLLAAYARARGMILDLRANNGGDEGLALRVAAHFTATPVVYGYTRTRNGPRHEDFGPMTPKTLQPGATSPFRGPVVALVGRRTMSSGEWFALMIRACPHGKLVGDRTRGASGNPRVFSLPNGVSYSISSWVACDAEGRPFEDRGLEPDILVPATRSFDAERDYVLEQALLVVGAARPPAT